MSAVLRAPFGEIAALRVADLDALMTIETRAYDFPWSRGNFVDSMSASYQCQALWIERNFAGYSVLMHGVDEAHLLNLTIAPQWQRRGWGAVLLDDVVVRAQAQRAQRLFLEVRPSNAAGLALYAKRGFVKIGVRRQYYPGAGNTREDALVLALELRA